MAFSTEETVEPFWAEFSSAASGRDPLAIQNSSVVIYTKMVVGITNVTNRIRYNGFFCWIFDAILQKIDKKNSLQEQIRYSRRAELLLAYIMVKNYPDITGVSGSAYAANNITPTINLKKGADWEFKQKGEKVYWQNSQGIFGQYYSGVTRVLNLINHPNSQLDLNVYTLTGKGMELAQFFAENITDVECDLFLQSVLRGNIHESDLEKLKSFALHLIPENSLERNFYQKAMLAADDRKAEPTFHRRETIKLLLAHLEQKKEGIDNPVDSFLRDNYRSHQNELLLQKDTATAWYLFEINELIHVAYEHFHSCFLYFIETYPTLLDNNIDELVKETLEAFDQVDTLNGRKNIRQLSASMKDSKEDIYVFYNAMEKAFRVREFGKCLMYATNTMLQLQVNISKQIEQLKEFAAAPENNFNRIGYAIELIDELVVSQMELTINDYLRTILFKAINLHTFSSYSKTRIGQSLVHNFMIEDYLVWRLRETLPNRTTPRLQNVIQFLADLGWVKREGKVFSITDSGTKITEDI
jgi:hypothetical protein